MNEPAGDATPTYKDRTAGLIVFGVAELGLALLCLLGFAAVLVSLSFLAKSGTTLGPQTNVGAVVAGSLFYLLMAAFFGTMGVGSLRARRWARTLMLIFSWGWLVIGVFALLILLTLSGKMFAAAAGGDPQAAAFAQGCMIFIMALFYLVLPVGFVLFYRSPHVKATVEAKDPKIRWTDRCPAPVLALSLLYGYGSLASLMGLGYGAVPVFGRIVKGPVTVVLLLVLAGILAWLSVALYRLRPAAWWVALALWILGSVSSAFLFLPGFDWPGLYRDMGVMTPQLEQMGQMGIFEIWQSPMVQGVMAVMWVAGLGYLLWVRQYFRRTVPDL